MAAHRYWRADQFSVYGSGTLELAEFGLLAGGTRVDGPATLTASTAPATGTLSNLQDADGNTVATWSASATLALTWDFGGSPVEVDDIRLHSLVDWLRFPYRVRIQWSDDGTAWTTLVFFTGISWPGVRAQTTSVPQPSLVPVVVTLPAAAHPIPPDTRVRLLLPFDGADGSTTFTDASSGARTVTASGNVQIDTAQSKWGGSSVLFDGSGDFLSILHDSALAALSARNFKIEMWVRFASVGGTAQIIFNKAAGTGFYPIQLYLESSSKLAARGFDQGSSQVVALIQTGTVTTGVWYHVAVTRAFNTFTLWVDGAAEASTTFSGLLFADTSAITLGAYSTGTFGFNGWMDDFQLTIYEETLIQMDVARGGAVLPPTLSAPTASNTGPFTTRLLEAGQGRTDYNQVLRGTGVGRVAGTVKDKATPPPHTPVRERVRLYEQLSGRLVRETISNATTGAYSFDYVDETLRYFVVSVDKEGAYRAVIADNLTPEIIT